MEEKLDIPRVTIWSGLAVRSNTPKEVIDTLEKALVAAASQPVYREKVFAMGLTFGLKTASEFGKKWRDDLVWIAKAAEPFKNNLNR
ncbi:Tripartite tricarboxylate transporter family receptor [compost metagenome]